jgi:glutamate synthase domain-containing protein 3
MSGGVAYVLDEDGTFADRCNTGMVGLDRPSEADAIELRAMVAEHLARTGSPVAERVLAEWELLLSRGAFVKVMPNDYKRVLRELAEEEQRAALARQNGSLAASRPLDAVGETGP